MLIYADCKLIIHIVSVYSVYMLFYVDVMLFGNLGCKYGAECCN